MRDEAARSQPLQSRHDTVFCEHIVDGEHRTSADIGFRGAKTKVDGKMVDAYDLFVGGRLGEKRRFNELLKGKIIAGDVHLVIDSLLKSYHDKKQADETLSEFLERTPKPELLAVLPERYRA